MPVAKSSVAAGPAVIIRFIGVVVRGYPQRCRFYVVPTFGFGLVHGFGFANGLREPGLPSAGRARSLVSFNLGVEAGQIVIVGSLWPILWWINRQSWAVRFRTGLSVIIFLFGAAWFVERTFRLKFMPF